MSMSRPRILEESRTGASFLVMRRSDSTGRYTFTLESRPFTLMEQIFSNTAEPEDACRARRVQLVRGEGRDVPTLYGREGGAKTPAEAAMAVEA